MSGYLKCFDKTKYTSSLKVKNCEKACNKAWNKISNIMLIMLYYYFYIVFYIMVSPISSTIWKRQYPSYKKSWSSIAFVKKALDKNVRTTFVKVKGQLLNGNVKLNTEKVLMKFHLNKHFKDIINLRLEYNTVKDKIEGEIGFVFMDKC